MREFFPTDMSNEKEEGKPVDPFVKEIHTGERVLESVKEVLQKMPRDLKTRLEIHLKRAAESNESWERMLEDLPPEEQDAFRYVIAQDLENFYYTHYNAVRKRLDSAPW